jgi:hypothetical protein
MASGADKRKNLRRAITYRAYIDFGDGSPAHECIICDASQIGALLETANPGTIPNKFTLALSVDGAARRKCRVAWRTKRQIGVEFLKDDKKDVRPIMLPVGRVAEPAGALENETEPEAGDRFDIESLTPG